MSFSNYKGYEKCKQKENPKKKQKNVSICINICRFCWSNW